MKIALEISMYAMTEEYLTEVEAFLAKLHENEDLVIRVNTLSTQVYGEFDRVMAAVNSAVKRTFDGGTRASFVMKVLPGELDPDYRYDG